MIASLNQELNVILNLQCYYILEWFSKVLISLWTI